MKKFFYLWIFAIMMLATIFGVAVEARDYDGEPEPTPCWSCGGSGRCTACGGTGEITVQEWVGAYDDAEGVDYGHYEECREICNDCYGSGQCQACLGNGMIY